MKRKIQLTLETAETFVVQTPRSIQRHYCPVCRTLVDMVSPYVLARVAELTDGESRSANTALLVNNARVAARIALALTQVS